MALPIGQLGCRTAAVTSVIRRLQGNFSSPPARRRHLPTYDGCGWEQKARSLVLGETHHVDPCTVRGSTCCPAAARESRAQFESAREALTRAPEALHFSEDSAVAPPRVRPWAHLTRPRGNDTHASCLHALVHLLACPWLVPCRWCMHRPQAFLANPITRTLTYAAGPD